jgi:hypothetical protein
VLHSLLRVIEAHLCRSSAASWQARFGAVSFIHLFGASLAGSHRELGADRSVIG